MQGSPRRFWSSCLSTGEVVVFWVCCLRGKLDLVKGQATLGQMPMMPGMTWPNAITTATPPCSSFVVEISS